MVLSFQYKMFGLFEYYSYDFVFIGVEGVYLEFFVQCIIWLCVIIRNVFGYLLKLF